MEIDTGDACLSCELFGASLGESAPLIICAHGFPDCARSFRAQVDPLVADGFRVALPTMRGYAPSSTARSGRYDAAALGRDLLAVADALSPDATVGLFGHDWGAIAAYAACALDPSRVRRLATAAVPHLRTALPRWLAPAQLWRSWYMGLFQLPRLAERRLMADDMALVDTLWRAWSPGYDCPADEMRHVKDAIAPNAKAVLGYYRALVQPFGESRSLLFRRTSVPALYLHGADDGCVGSELATGVGRGYASGVDVHVIHDAGHFVHLEQPERVNALLRGFFS